MADVVATATYARLSQRPLGIPPLAGASSALSQATGLSTHESQPHAPTYGWRPQALRPSSAIWRNIDVGTDRDGWNLFPAGGLAPPTCFLVSRGSPLVVTPEIHAQRPEQMRAGRAACQGLIPTDLPSAPCGWEQACSHMGDVSYSEGWEQNGLYEFFRAKMRARRRKGQEKRNR